jgi:hypothetical protein
MLLTEECTKSAMHIKNEIRVENGMGEISDIEQLMDITIRFVEIDGLVRVMLEIGDKTTHKDIRAAIPLILKWRDQVRDKQALKVSYNLFHNIQRPTNKEELLELLSYLQEHGVSYTKLAERFNAMIIKSLDAIQNIQQKNEITTEELVYENRYIVYVENLLSALGIKNINLKDSLEQITAGERPFEKGYPVSRFKIIEVLRTWRKNKLHIMTQKALEKVREFEKKQGG